MTQLTKLQKLALNLIGRGQKLGDKLERLTARASNGMAYLAKVKDNEQEVEGAYNTLKCIQESWQRLAELEDKIERGELVDISQSKINPISVKMLSLITQNGKYNNQYNNNSHFRMSVELLLRNGISEELILECLSSLADSINAMQEANLKFIEKYGIL